MHRRLRWACAALIGMTGALCATSHADPLPLTVTLDTQPLQGNGTFYLDFELTGTGGNTVTISNFSFGNGGASGTATPYAGDASIDGSGNVSLDSINGVFDNELYEQFTPGDSLSFTISGSENLATSGGDSFFFNILDSTLNNIPTSGPNSEILSIDYSTGNPGGGPEVNFYGSSTFNLNAPSISTPSSAPLPSTAYAGIGLLGLAGTWCFAGRRRQIAR